MRNTILALLLVGCMAPAAIAQYSTTFESLNASDTGVVLTGQDGFYIPPDTDSVDYLAYTYVDNVLGLPFNPNKGGKQFVAGTGPAGDPTLFFARAQRDMSYAGSDVWTVSYDIAVTFTGELPTAQNTGSFSTQLFPNAATCILLARWTDPNTAANWNADMVWFDAAGTQLIEEIPDANFQGLDTDHWYSQSMTFDLVTNRVLEVTLTDLTTETTYTYDALDRYLWGGAAGAPTPSGFRLFAGGSVAGNTLAFDNIDIFVPGGAKTVVADSFNAFRGFHASGALEDTFESDDIDLCHDLGITIFPSEAPITLDFVGTLPNDSPASLDVTIESSANTPGLGLTILFWNFNTSSWDEVGTAAQGFNADTVRTFAGTPADHVEAGTGAVRTRYEVRQVGIIFQFPWTDCIDQLFWTVSG